MFEMDNKWIRSTNLKASEPHLNSAGRLLASNMSVQVNAASGSLYFRVERAIRQDHIMADGRITNENGTVRPLFGQTHLSVTTNILLIFGPFRMGFGTSHLIYYLMVIQYFGGVFCEDESSVTLTRAELCRVGVYLAPVVWPPQMT
jgi:hypothetical protein